MLPIAGLVYLLLVLALVLQGRGARRRELLWGALLAAVLVTAVLVWEHLASRRTGPAVDGLESQLLEV